jgi:DNA-binding transcriptional ArsR family regulator
MHNYPCIMSEPMQPREVRDIEELRALAHPMRQRILRRLHDSGPATSTTLARDLGENSGIMSYHLRLLAGHDFVRQVAGRGQGRERWWEASPQPTWIPREGLSVKAQAEASGLRPAAWADALAGFERFRAARQAMGEWGRGTWVRGRTTLALTREQAVQFIADQQELVRRYQQDANDARPGARTVVFASVTYPEPTPDEEPKLGTARVRWKWPARSVITAGNAQDLTRGRGSGALPARNAGGSPGPLRRS